MAGHAKAEDRSAVFDLFVDFLVVNIEVVVIEYVVVVSDKFVEAPVDIFEIVDICDAFSQELEQLYQHQVWKTVKLHHSMLAYLKKE